MQTQTPEVTPQQLEEELKRRTSTDRIPAEGDVANLTDADIGCLWVEATPEIEQREACPCVLDDTSDTQPVE